MDLTMLQTRRKLAALSSRLRTTASLGVVFIALGGGVDACPQNYQNAPVGTIFEIVSCGDARALDDFAGTGGDLDDEQKAELRTSGWQAADDFLADWDWDDYLEACRGTNG